MNAPMWIVVSAFTALWLLSLALVYVLTLRSEWKNENLHFARFHATLENLSRENRELLSELAGYEEWLAILNRKILIGNNVDSVRVRVYYLRYNLPDRYELRLESLGEPMASSVVVAVFDEHQVRHLFGEEAAKQKDRMVVLCSNLIVREVEHENDGVA